MRARFASLGVVGRLAAFAALLAAVAAGATALGSATGGGTPTRAASAHGDEMAMAPMTPAAHAQASGLASTAGGFSLEPVQTKFGVGNNVFHFRIVDGDGRPQHDFTEEGGVRLHLIVVRRDLVGYTHVHPQLQPDGSWAVSLTTARPGVYRAFADFERDGVKTVLGTDLFVSGSMAPQPLPAPSTVTSTDGYRIELTAPSLRAGKESALSFAVTRNGHPVRTFQDYVGMRGHLVALHAGDLAYSHVHPLDGSAPGRIEFRAELEAPGSYRLFLQFKVAGVVHTAPFTVEVAR